MRRSFSVGVSMKPFKGSLKQTVKEYWSNMMHSLKNNKISRGAANFAKSMSQPFKDNWRRSQNVKKKPHE
jgi:hypothetical protein